MTAPEARVVPFLLLGDTRRRTLLAGVRSAIERWSRAWVASPHADFEVEIHATEALGTVNRWSETVCFSAHTGQQGCALRIQMPPRLIPSLIGAHEDGLGLSATDMLTGTTLAGELETEAVHALARELLDPQRRQVLTFELLPNAGVEQLLELQAERYTAALVTFTQARAPFSILLSPAYMAALLPGVGRAPTAEPLERRMSGVAEQTVVTEELLGHAEISVADLARLTVGDVIVLSEPLSGGGELRVADGARIGSTILGCNGGQRAIQLRPLPSKGKSR